MNNDLKEFMTEEENIAYLRAYKGSRMIIDGFQRRIDDAIAERKQVCHRSVEVLVQKLNISVEEAMQILNITKEILS